LFLAHFLYFAGLTIYSRNFKSKGRVSHNISCIQNNAIFITSDNVKKECMSWKILAISFKISNYLALINERSFWKVFNILTRNIYLFMMHNRLEPKTKRIDMSWLCLLFDQWGFRNCDNWPITNEETMILLIPTC